MSRNKIKGDQIQDESVESVDIASGSIKAGEVHQEMIVGQPSMSYGALDIGSDMLLVADASDASNPLKQLSPTVLAAGIAPMLQSSTYFTDVKVGSHPKLMLTGNLQVSNPMGYESGQDNFFFVSGAVASKDTSVTGTAVFGGDLVVSGVLHGAYAVSYTHLTLPTILLV